jgi:hypothetical protein
VLSSTTSWPARRCLEIARAASTTMARSGSLVLPSGVGTQMMMASHSDNASKSWRARSRPERTAAPSRSVGTSLMYDSPRLTASTLAAERSNPVTASPASANSTESGRPT